MFYSINQDVFGTLDTCIFLFMFERMKCTICTEEEIEL